MRATVRPGSLELVRDTAIVGPREALLRERRPRGVAAQALERGSVVLGDDDIKRARIGFSLIAFEACTGDECKTTSTFALIDELKQRTSRREQPPSGMFAPAGVATMALSLLSIIALGATALFAWKKHRLAWKVLPTSIALLAIMAALIAGCLFVAKKPGGYGAVGVGPSFWAFAIACVIGIAGAQLLTKFIKPIDPDLGASSNAL